ncbi:hypothetical protein ElyMa_006751700 [Elysia marginata]|uniref:Uncharacterized protein n=1 Tax=Elysia marginata TaxID=1093978 RepID=A0AAV4IZP5_9GAST|nr:hypothetical protein ElyMa_006751700 [Elysia marginata]
MRSVQSALSSARPRSRGHKVTAPSRPRTKLALARRREQGNQGISGAGSLSCNGKKNQALGDTSSKKPAFDVAVASS